MEAIGRRGKGQGNVANQQKKSWRRMHPKIKAVYKTSFLNASAGPILSEAETGK